MGDWLKNAVFYEIYPQSFYDTNEDGIGDINGITAKLDYIKGLGCNAIWINPCYDSPMKDAGYDVRDYKKVASRYGTNEDLYRLFGEAHKRDMHILLDLVPGHTSEEHEWFLKSQKQDPNEFSGRYIWSTHAFWGSHDYPYIGGESERNGVYFLNFFKCQPALNYGWLNPKEDWQDGIDSPNAIATREAMKDVMRFWLDHGCDGFRVDMAASLVKNDDEEKTGTSKIWQDIRKMLDEDYPEARMVAEWSDPPRAIRAGYHMDFVLNHPGHGYSKLARDYYNHPEDNKDMDKFFTGQTGEDPCLTDHSYFRKDDGADITAFLKDYQEMYDKTKGKGYISLLTCNHDTTRPRFNMTPRELSLYYSFLFTMPGVPFMYYGDEIGMRYLNLPTKEGGYGRTGSRTPMQWKKGKNLGFSDASPSDIYLPVDWRDDAPTVEEEEKDPSSLLNTVRSVLKLRADNEDLQSDGSFESLYAKEGQRPFAYKRGGFIIVINPSGQEETVPVDASGRKVVWQIGNGQAEGSSVKAGPQSFIVFA
ncbi:alpha-amylase family glycosyl hydrolase [Butyrivibrio sp. MC2013]|uniref:alpha-amylase family glycosyl hydrolase n=1 Tax=Butyrivibrio sp. MC2013 TaxID=1280686 RepID=UPI00041E95D5|nr:alpha-amylase family glycosyl hydrolase [Butyrivibrio sp. MC2013]